MPTEPAYAELGRKLSRIFWELEHATFTKVTNLWSLVFLHSIYNSDNMFSWKVVWFCGSKRSKAHLCSASSS